MPRTPSKYKVVLIVSGHAILDIAPKYLHNSFTFREETTDELQQTDEKPKTRYVINNAVISFSLKVNGVKQSMPVDYTLPNHDKKVC